SIQAQAISSRNEQFKRQMDETTASITSLQPQIASVVERHKASVSAVNAQAPVIALLATKPVRVVVGTVALLMKREGPLSPAFSRALEHFIEVARRELETDASSTTQPWDTLLGPPDPDPQL